MNMRTFMGLTSRSVLEQVRAELGADAVIVSNRQTADGIEITALAGRAFDAVLTGSPQPAPKHATAPAAAPAASATPAAEAPRAETGLTQRLMEEVRSLRGMIEGQFSQLAWGESTRLQPARAAAARDLLGARYSAALTRRITENLPAGHDAAQAREWVQGILVRNLPCPAPADDIVTRGGVYAIVGPTGVGKTTTTAKLAARCAVRYGSAQLALLTTDSYRIGAQDQLRIYAKILGVTVHTVSDGEDLRMALDEMRGRHLVLIDTVGMGQWDERVVEHARWLGQCAVQRLLVLNATAQAETLEEVVRAYRQAPEAAGSLAGCIVSKIDEAARLGPVLDIVIRHKLALRYVSNGQRVPEDLHAPDPRYLVHRSMHIRGGVPACPPPVSRDEEFAMTLGAPGALAHA